MSSGTQLVHKIKPVRGLDSVVPSSSTPKYVNLANYNHLTVLIMVKNATTVTGSAITLKQASDTAATGEKALAFTKMWSNIDQATLDLLAQQTVVSNTFTTDNTDSKSLMYVIEVDAADLDVTNGFSCVRAGTGNATAATVTVVYLLSGATFGGNVAQFPTAL